MIGWLAIVAMAGAAFALLWRFGGMPRAGLELTGAALLIGFAGYAWQGSPGAAGRPTVPKTDSLQPDGEFAKERNQYMTRVGTSAQWLDFADALHRMGKNRSAVTAIKSGLAKMPNDADLWAGLGNALVVHADGMVSPAAKFAFDRAAKIAPDHPGPPFFLGLAYAQAGQTDKAAETWQALLARSPPDAQWRADVEARLAQIARQPRAMP